MFHTTGTPHNFKLEQITSQTAEFTFNESLSEFGLGEYATHPIVYNITCTDVYNKKIVATTNATIEEKRVTVSGLNPYHDYRCNLTKFVAKFNVTQVVKNVLSFTTLEDG